jgi:F-type H+-transporting ATPase subunit gamma
LSGTADLARHPLLREQPGHTCFVVITSDKGLAGSLNSAVTRRVEREIRERNIDKQSVKIAPIGRKAREYFRIRDYQILPVLPDEYTNVSDDVLENDIEKILVALLNSRNVRDIGNIFIVYQNFISTFEQQPTVRQLVPITRDMIAEMIAGIRPARGKYAPQQPEQAVHPAAYTIEPDADSVLAVLLPRLLNIALFHALLESKASEHSARMVAMKSATDKAKEKAKEFTRVFNKVRQAAITREVSEITSGIEAMR